MRFKNTSGAIKIYAVAGTQTVLLSFDIAKSKISTKNFIGFDIEREDSKGKIIKLNGSKRFQSLQDDPSITDPEIKNRSLVQSYFWKDYLANPGQTYTYTITTMFGKANNFDPGYSRKIKITTEPLQKGKHAVYFNYGVTGSQAYVKRFQRKLITELPPEEQALALKILGRELWQDGLIKFVQQAVGPQYQLYGAFYEFQYNDFLSAVKLAKDSGATVEICYSAKPGQKEKNELAIATAGIKSFCFPRTKVSQPHNKFMLLCKNNKPIQVWTGSTNITLQGIFGHSNTGHSIKDEKISADYFAYWQTIRQNPSVAPAAVVSETLQGDTDLTKLKEGTYVFFSPRKTETLLTNYANLIDKAKSMACMILPFDIDDVFTEVYKKDKDYLRYILFEKGSKAAAMKSNDYDLMVTAGAVYDGDEKNWAKEFTAKTSTKAGILYVHNKFFLIDPLSASPVVVTGSGNFSGSSITKNDENTLVIVGETRVADIYLTEFSRLFEHFWPRYLSTILPKSKKGFSKPLDESYTWFNDYYNPNRLGRKRKETFAKMKLAFNGNV